MTEHAARGRVSDVMRKKRRDWPSIRRILRMAAARRRAVHPRLFAPILIGANVLEGRQRARCAAFLRRLLHPLIPAQAVE